MDPRIFIMKSMNNEKMGEIQGQSRLLRFRNGGKEDVIVWISFS